MEKTKLTKINSKKGPQGTEKNTTTELIPEEGGEVKQVTKEELEVCPSCGAPVDELSEMKGACSVEGCSVSLMCENCAITTECGGQVCKDHAFPIMGAFDKEQTTTLIACPEHKPRLQKRVYLNLLSDIWVNQSKNNYRETELKLKGKEVKAKSFEAIVPLLAERIKDKTRQKELRLRLFELMRKKKRDLLDFQIRKESNALKKERIEADKQIARDELEAKLLELKADYELRKDELNLKERVEERKLKELSRSIKKDEAELDLKDEELRLKAKSEKRKQAELGLKKQSKERKKKGQQHHMLMEELKLALEAGKLDEIKDNIEFLEGS